AMLERFVSEKKLPDHFETIFTDIKQILKSASDGHTVVFADDDTLCSDDDCVDLDSLNDFVQHVITIGDSIERLTRSNRQLWRIADLEKSALTHQVVNPANDSVVKNVCYFTGQLIELFAINQKLVDLCLTNPTAGSLKTINVVGKKFKYPFPLIANSMFLLLHNAPRTANSNVRNALVLIILYLNNVRSGKLPYGDVTCYLDACKRTDSKYSVSVKRFKRLNVLIVNQLESYAIDHCKSYRTVSVNGLVADNASKNDIKQILLVKYDEISNCVRFHISGTGSCKIDMAHASYASLVEGKRAYGSAMLGLDGMKFLWKGIHRGLKYIRKDVIFSFDAVSFARYQVLVQNGVTAVLFGYILNILKASGTQVSFSPKQLSSVRSDVDEFEKIVFSISERSAPHLVFKLLRLYLNLRLVYKNVLVFLIDTIENQLTAYGIDLPAFYYTILTYNTVSYNIVQDIDETFLKPLHTFVYDELTPFRKDFYCVGQYMMLHLD
ncbi:MAG: hypothetical protein ACRYE8_05625, partial [Janthinobacterium lividum]